MKHKIIMLKGLQGSGKSTWAKNQKPHSQYEIVSMDVIREENGGYSRKREKKMLQIRDEKIIEGLQSGKNVIVDATNLNPIHEARLRQLARENDAEFIIKSFLNVDIDTCIARDLIRPNSVGQQVIWTTYDKWIASHPPVNERLEKEWKLPRVILFDIDGTLAHNEEGRNIYQYDRVKEDSPDPFVSFVARQCRINDKVDHDSRHKYLIGILSGRTDDCMQETKDWLDNVAMVDYDFLYMRKTGDKRSDEVVKKEIYETKIKGKYCVLGIFDDRPKVTRMWRELGLNVAQMGNPYIDF